MPSTKSRHHLLLQTIITHATLAYSFHTSFLIDIMVHPMKTEESTPIAARMSKADIMQFQQSKAWYEECKRNTIHCTIEDIDFTEETKHEIWLTFLYSPLKRYIVEGKVVIRPDDEQRTEILLNNSQVNYPDIADKEYCHMLLELVNTAVFHLYISKDKTSGMEKEEYSDNNGDSIKNVLHNCVISGNENSLSVGGNVSVGSATIGDVKADRGGLM